ncbi:MAG: hypothetical protein JOY82_02410 [Streptosporangiaceae bacterium]|nr:hypothetical protein [Streptosporangiaceae bacterium]MBV9853362.1 hypothetical protein [Streptosporangiaceae bacterium]
MSTGAIIAIVIVVLVVAAVAAVVTRQMRRRALRGRFGPEYERLAAEKGSRQAEAELTARERRVAQLDLHPLTAEQRAHYAGEWTAVQERFVDDPAGAVAEASALVAAVERDRGYPAAEDRDEEMANLSVDHAGAVTGYRQAREITDNAPSASTDDLRRAMIQYRTLFQELTGGDVPAADAAAADAADPAAPAATTEAGDGRTAANATKTSTTTTE